MSTAPAVGVGIMILRGDRVLLGRRLSKLGRGTWGWCGGAVEPGETVMQAARRELTEETGLVASDLSLLSVAMVEVDSSLVLDFEFLAGGVYEQEPYLKEPDKVERWEWHSLHRLPEPLFPPVAVGLRAYFSGGVLHSL